ncbi:MAG: Gamma-tocopherol methyltransferase [Myxococcales bacterium]|nr:Gamma-tocopherol methyltransferase [Myxococcales bacterium]
MTLRRPPPDVITDWYDRKTDFVLQKYGPGPRVHYHTGLAPADIVPASDENGLRRQLWRSQEDMLWRAVRAWDVASFGGHVLDVGCGLGGTSLFLATELGSSMTALSPVARHLEWVSRFALQAGVRERVQPLLADAHELTGPPRFDAALSFGATPYFDREGYFESLARAVRPGGQVFIEDTFIGRAELAAPFNEYWTANLGWLHEYVAAAALHGFDLLRLDDVSREAVGFWKLSVAYSRMLSAERPASIAWHSDMHDAYLDGGLRDLLLSFRKR